VADFTVTIDGPAASGKSTAARLLAKRLGAAFLDTGAMYRGVTFAAMQKGIKLDDERQLVDLLKETNFEFDAATNGMGVRIDGVDVTEQIRGEDITKNSRYIAAAPAVRAELVRMQREFAAEHKKVVTEGRDQGTVAFPDADVKFFLTADIETRARRRMNDLKDTEKANLEQVMAAIIDRDAKDTTRADGPLKPAADAVKVDSSELSIEQMVDLLVSYVKDRCS
jgi:cytidylate kinase